MGAPPRPTPRTPLASTPAHLGGAAGGVHQHHAVARHVGRVQRADEQLVVRAVDGVAALRGQQGGLRR